MVTIEANTWTSTGRINNLPTYGEVKGIAKSIARWVWKRDGYCYQEFIDRQKRRGAIGGKKSKGGGRPSLGEPWQKIGISRRTWFRKFGTKQA